MKMFAAVTGIVLAGLCAGALAAELTIGQKNRVFSRSEVSVKKGDSIVFVNDDDIMHNVLSNTPGYEFNLGSQPPGMATPVNFNKAGQLNVLCAIHPRMRLMVKVAD
jgi:plastocyanin